VSGGSVSQIEPWFWARLCEGNVRYTSRRGVACGSRRLLRLRTPGAPAVLLLREGQRT